MLVRIVKKMLTATDRYFLSYLQKRTGGVPGTLPPPRRNRQRFVLGHNRTQSKFVSGQNLTKDQQTIFDFKKKYKP